MELTVQITTSNCESEIGKTIRSIKQISSAVIVADMGSIDSTVRLAEYNGAKVLRFPHDADISEVRNTIINQSETEWQLYLHAGEVLLQGHDLLREAKGSCSYVSVLQDNLLSKEIRLWKKSSGFKFNNPVYEFLDATTNQEVNAIIYASKSPNYSDNLERIERWKINKPTAREPYYFQALTLLAQQKYDDFLRVAEHYMFIDKKNSMPSTMIRYYYALVQLRLKRKVRPVLQNLNLCICAKPLMAEFWCLQGDVYYHLLHKFEQAKEYYQYATTLGSRRLRTDKWPMDISKYKEYPEKMIYSCDKILETRSVYL